MNVVHVCPECRGEKKIWDDVGERVRICPACEGSGEDRRDIDLEEIGFE